MSVKPLKVTVSVDNVDLDMEVDTGASVSIISEVTYSRLWPEGQQPSLQGSAITLYAPTVESSCLSKEP